MPISRKAIDKIYWCPTYILIYCILSMARVFARHQETNSDDRGPAQHWHKCRYIFKCPPGCTLLVHTCDYRLTTVPCQPDLDYDSPEKKAPVFKFHSSNGFHVASHSGHQEIEGEHAEPIHCPNLSQTSFKTPVKKRTPSIRVWGH